MRYRQGEEKNSGDLIMKWKHQIKVTKTADMTLRYARLNYIGSDVLVFLVYLLCCGDLCSILEPEGIKKD